MEVKLTAETGRPTGTRPSRRLRREGKVPAVVYGRELDQPIAVAVDRKELYAALHTEAGLNALIRLELPDGEKHLTLAREVQRHPVRGDVIHLDFIRISLKEKVEAEVAIHFVGEPEGVRLHGGIVETLANTVLIEALPTDIPAAIELDISGLDVGDVLRVADLPALEGVTYLDDPETPLVTVSLPSAVLAEEEGEGVEGELAEGEEAPAAEAGEVVEPGGEEA